MRCCKSRANRRLPGSTRPNRPPPSQRQIQRRKPATRAENFSRSARHLHGPFCEERSNEREGQESCARQIQADVYGMPVGALEVEEGVSPSWPPHWPTFLSPALC